MSRVLKVSPVIGILVVIKDVFFVNVLFAGHLVR